MVASVSAALAQSETIALELKSVGDTVAHTRQQGAFEIGAGKTVLLRCQPLWRGQTVTGCLSLDWEGGETAYALD